MAETTIETLFRDFVNAGVPSSGAHKPVKKDIRDTLQGRVGYSISGRETVKTDDYTIVSSDAGRTIIFNKASAVTASLTAAATLAAAVEANTQFQCRIFNIGAGAVTIDPASAETINGQSTRALVQYEGATIWTDGTTWRADVGGSSDLPMVTAYGANGDGSTDDLAAFTAALAAHDVVGVPYKDTAYVVSDKIPLSSGQWLVPVGGRPKLSLVSATNSLLFDMDGLTDTHVDGFEIIGTNAAQSASMVTMDGAVRCSVNDNHWIDCPSGVDGVIHVNGTHCEVVGGRMANPADVGIHLNTDASGCDVSGILFSERASFGVRVNGYRNRIVGNRDAETDGSRGSAGLLELIGVQFPAHDNEIAGNVAQNCGDNGISVSGYRNRVIGNLCRYNDKAGIHVWGSDNIVVGNTCIGNNRIAGDGGAPLWAGIGCSSNYGGTGQGNTFTGNVCDDDQDTPTQFNSIRMGGMTYDEWTTATEYTKSAQGTYLYYGVNIYLMVTSGTVTSGATPPTHTTGEVSDGAITWRWVNAFAYSSVANDRNFIAGNICGVSANAEITDIDGVNTILSNENWIVRPHASMYLTPAATNPLFIGEGATNWLRGYAGSPGYILRPETDQTVDLGLVNRRYRRIFLSDGLWNATDKVVNATAAAGWGVPSGTLTRTTFATYAGQTVSDPPTQAEVQTIDNHLKVVSERLAALINDLNKDGASPVHGLLKTS